MHREGADLAFTYQNDRLKGRVEEMATGWNSNMCFPCDVSSDKEIDNLFAGIAENWDGLDIIVHSVAYAPADQIEGDYLQSIIRTHIDSKVGATLIHLESVLAKLQGLIEF